MMMWNLIRNFLHSRTLMCVNISSSVTLMTVHKGSTTLFCTVSNCKRVFVTEKSQCFIGAQSIKQRSDSLSLQHLNVFSPRRKHQQLNYSSMLPRGRSGVRLWGLITSAKFCVETVDHDLFYYIPARNLNLYVLSG